VHLAAELRLISSMSGTIYVVFCWLVEFFSRHQNVSVVFDQSHITVGIVISYPHIASQKYRQPHPYGFF